MNEDGSIQLRRLGGSVQDLEGIARRPWHRPVTLKEMDESIMDHLAAEDERIRGYR
jgi:hypothetical protein